MGGHPTPVWYWLTWTVFAVAAWACTSAALAPAHSPLAYARRLMALCVLGCRRLIESLRAFCKDARAGWSRSGTDRHDVAMLALLMGIGLWVRLSYIHQPMRYDEACTYMYSVKEGLLHGLLNYHGPNNHVFHSLWVIASTAAFGSAPWAIRLPALVAGLLAIPGVFLCARWGIRQKAGLIAAALVAVSPYQVLYSTNARGYSMVALAMLVAIPLGRYMVERSSAFACLLLAIVSSLALLTVPSAAIGLAGIALWLVVLALNMRHEGGAWGRAGRLVAWSVLTATFTGLLYAPVAWRTGGAALTPGVWRSGWAAIASNKFVTPLPVDEFLGTIWPMARRTATCFLRDTPWHALVLLGAGCIVGLVGLYRSNRAGFLCFASMLAGAGGVVLVRRVAPPARVWSFALPLVFVLCDCGLSAAGQLLRRPQAGRLVVVALVLMVVGPGVWGLLTTDHLLHYPDTGLFPEAEQVALLLKERLRPGDVVAAPSPATWPLRYYLDRHGVPWQRYAFGEEIRRLYWVYGVRHGPALSDAMKEMAAEGSPRPQLIKSYKTARVYQVTY